MYQKTIKRIIDFSISLIGLVLISPIFLLVWLLLTVANKEAGVFFTQARPGKNEKIFRVIKFKTMTDEKDCEGNLLPDSQRLTKIGQFVRSASLDEIPQLINVLKGEMSLIGPRPLVAQYLQLYSEKQRKRHEIRPGITGWAQVNGRNLMKLSKKFEYDVWYVEHVSFLLDCKITIQTISNVLRSKDIGKGAEDMAEVDDLQFMERLKKLNHDNN